MMKNEPKLPSKEDFEKELQNFKISFGGRIKYFRDRRNFTQEYLAELVNIEQASLSNIERGKSHPTFETMFRLACALGVKPYQFYAIEPKLSPNDMKQEILDAMSFDNSLTELIYKFFHCVR